MKCKNCEKNDAIKYSKYSTGEFCCRECARGFSTKNKRSEINEKVSKKLVGRKMTSEFIIKITGKNNGSYKHGELTQENLLKENDNRNMSLIKKCPTCEKIFEVTYKKKMQIFCSIKCVRENEKLNSNTSKRMSDKCKSLDEKIRLREIGRKGGFGKKGYTKGGIYYQSSIEKVCFEWLENNKISFEPHKNIPNSSKVSDIYLLDIDYWIEIDGIDREKRKKWIGKDYEYWLEKLKIYKREKLNLKIVKNEKEFLKFLKEMNLLN